MGSTQPRPERIQLDKEHFSGRRRNVRRLCVMPVECRGTSGPFKARTVDLSRLGALLEIRDPRFAAGEKRLLDFAKAVAQEFPRTFTVRFADVPMALEVHVARVTRHPAAASLLIGCEFIRPLTVRQCRVLGLPTEETSEGPAPRK